MIQGIVCYQVKVQLMLNGAELQATEKARQSSRTSLLIFWSTGFKMRLACGDLCCSSIWAVDFIVSRATWQGKWSQLRRGRSVASCSQQKIFRVIWRIMERGRFNVLWPPGYAAKPQQDGEWALARGTWRALRRECALGHVRVSADHGNSMTASKFPRFRHRYYTFRKV